MPGEAIRDKEIAYITEEISKLKGATVVAVAAVADDESYGEVWPILQLRTPTGEILQVEVSADPEGNGPGFLFIDPI